MNYLQVALMGPALYLCIVWSSYHVLHFCKYEKKGKDLKKTIKVKTIIYKLLKFICNSKKIHQFQSIRAKVTVTLALRAVRTRTMTAF